MSRIDTAHSSWPELDLGEARRCRIEASAGTGKTWTITVLYLRLLLERGLSVRQIVVATFTDAAAQELRGRIRLRLLWAENAAQTCAQSSLAPTGEDDAQYLAQRWQSQHEVCARDQLRLRLALAELDLAPIGTLHSLCVRILSEHAFAAASGLELGELIATQELQDELLGDLKRLLAQSSAPLDAGDLYWLEHFPALESALRQLADPATRIEAPQLVDVDQIMQSDWAERLRDFAADDAKFVRVNSAYRSALRRLADYIERADISIEFKPEPLLAERTLDKQIKPALIEKLRKDPVVAFAEHAANALPEHITAVRAQALQRYREQLQKWREQRLRERDLFTYDALIERVYRALSATTPTLADQLYGAWPVALIDEFQDTDARQYAILDRIYRDARSDDNGAERGCLVMIGDPKQAIYAFRGGDIHTYERAVRAVDQRLSLDINRRSSRDYVAGLNAFYALAAPGFTRDGETARFDYVTVLASARRDPQPYLVDGVSVSRPLVFHYRDDPPESKPQREREALQACARHIAELLAARTHTIAGEPVVPSDIAVLLPNHRHILMLHRLLTQSGVPCAGVGRQAVFNSPWARELQVLLYGLEHIDDTSAVRAALTTRLLGCSIDELRALAHDATRWQSELQAMHALVRIWQRQGVLALVQRLIERAAPRLAADNDYERDITDLRHLGELLQEASETLHGPTQLLAWLDAQRRDPELSSEDGDDRQLRIESDAARVRLLTLHASKGLEFRLVFLPLMWAHQAKSRALSAYPLITDAASGVRIADLGTAQRAERLRQAARDDQDERFRVLYVALTRAEYGCHVYALPPARSADARSINPLVDPERSALDALIERLLAAQQLHADCLHTAPGLEWREGWPTQKHFYRAPESAPPHIVVQALPNLRAVRGVHSFSTLVRHAHDAAVEEAAALDESSIEATVIADGVGAEDSLIAVPAPIPHPILLALDTLRGAELGNALHAVFEQRVAGQPLRAQLPLLLAMFQAYDVRLRQAGGDALALLWAERLDAVLGADLGDGLRLAALPLEDQRAELEFHFAVDHGALETLRRICAQHAAAGLIPDRLGQTEINGLVTGKIDLVLHHDGRFHVLDYKGNALGVQVENYATDALVAAMDAHHYRFQALIYTLALDRMLALRLPQYQRALHLGDAIYVFVRAAGLAPGAGVWRYRFDDALIENLQQALSITESTP